MLFAYLSWTVIIATFVVAVVSYVRRKAYFRCLNNIPGTPPTFLIGNIFWIVKLYARSKNLKYHPGVYISERIIGGTVLHVKTGMECFWLGVQPLVSVFRAEIMELILSSSISIEKSYEYEFLHKWLGTGLLTSKGEKWRHRRKLLTPSFHFRILDDFLPVFNQQSLILVKKLRSLSDKDYINITPHIILCTLDVICETIMGVSIEAQKGNNTEYVQAIHNLADFFNHRTAQPWLWSDFLFGLTSIGRKFNKDIETLHSFTDKVIKEKKDKLLSKGMDSSDTEDKGEDEYYAKQRKTFMDLLLDMHVNGQQLSEADIREEVDTFMFEGHDTTAMGIIFALYCIGLYPDVQNKILEEIVEIFGGDTERPVTHDDTRNMKYLECVLKESHRLYPSVPLIGRKLSEDIYFDDCQTIAEWAGIGVCGFEFHYRMDVCSLSESVLSNNMKIPKGVAVHINILGLHRNSTVFKNPEIFDPGRFSPENCLNRHPYAYVPFSAGPRNCIGQKFAMLEEKTVICNILRHFKVISLDPRDQFHIKIELTLRPAQEVRLKFIPRC